MRENENKLKQLTLLKLNEEEKKEEKAGEEKKPKQINQNFVCFEKLSNSILSCMKYSPDGRTIGAGGCGIYSFIPLLFFKKKNLCFIYYNRRNFLFV